MRKKRSTPTKVKTTSSNTIKVDQEKTLTEQKFIKEKETLIKREFQIIAIIVKGSIAIITTMRK